MLVGRKKTGVATKYLDNDNLRRYDVQHKHAQNKADELFSKLTARPVTKTKSSDPGEATAELLRKELRDDRLARDWRALTPEAQRQAVREAINKTGTSETARNLLFILLEDDKLSEQEASRAKTALMQGSNPDLYRQYVEIVGDGSVDAPGLLNVAKLAREKYVEHVRSLTTAIPTLSQMAESRGLAAPVVSDTNIILSREAAHDVALFRACQAEATAKGLELRIQSFENDGPPK